MQLEEHKLLCIDMNPRYKNLSLVQWSKPMPKSSWGYYASYFIGAEWIDDKESLVVTPKKSMGNIDFMNMFMTCFTSNLEVDSFSKIYSIDFEQRAINAPSLKSVVSPLIVLHFLGVVSRIKTLKRGYVHHSENLKKVKGHIRVMKNERLNIATKRYDRIFCNYDEYSVDIPENRLLKKALLFSKQMICFMGEKYQSYQNIKALIQKTLSLFENVSDEVVIKEVGQIKGHKLFKQYAEAIRLAKLVLRHFDFSINKVGNNDGTVVPFKLDMSLLYEHYVYGLLYAAYGDKIKYQAKGETGYPDFLYKSDIYKLILDTKYIPRYDENGLDTYVTRQLSGYSRDLLILKELGYDDVKEESSTPTVPCIIIYPEEGGGNENPFIGKQLKDLCCERVMNLNQFYKIKVKLPTIKP